MMYPTRIPGIPDSELDDHRRIPFEHADDEAESRELLKVLAQARAEAAAPKQEITAVATEDQSGNVLRPVDWLDIVGQDRTKRLMQRMVEVAVKRGQPLDHVLMVGPSGTGKTTFAHVIAHELGCRVYQLEAPVSADTLIELAGVMQDGDILFLDEIHQQAVGDRRGRSSNTQPEVLFSVMEDRTLPTGSGVLQFPHITVMGATTDEGMLPDAFINRFPIRPQLDEYTEDDMTEIARRNATALGLLIKPDIARIFARASRNVPREINNYLRNAAMLTDRVVTEQLAFEVVHDLNGVTDDGLTRDMQAMLLFLLKSKRYVKALDEVRYQASVNNIATACGKSRDVKAIQLRVEPWLIKQGYVQVLHGGRALTDLGVMRATRLTRGA
jgi:Holliday junction DNA helicase RuvB